jgi:carbamate kinase
MPILSKKKAEKSGIAHNNRNAETKRANAEKRMKNQKKSTAKALRMLNKGRGPSVGNIRQNKRAAATEHNYKTLHNGGTRRRRN